jgi:hypothetical protein
MKTQLFQSAEDYADNNIIKLNIGGKHLDSRYSIFKEFCNASFCKFKTNLQNSC